MRLIAGEAYGERALVKTHSPMFYVHAVLQEGARLAMPANHPERAAYVVSGSLRCAGRDCQAGQMLVFRQGAEVTLQAASEATVMLLGGEPIGERYLEWNFVSSSQERIEQAKTDWRAGRMKLPDADDGEFIPLPDEPSPAPNSMS